MRKVKDENKTIKEYFMQFHLRSFIDQPIYDIKGQLIDKNKTLKEYGFSNGDSLSLKGGISYFGHFTEKKFFEKIIISDLIKEKNENFILMDSPSRANCGEIFYNAIIMFEIIGSNEGPVFGGRDGRYSLDSNICKAAVFEGKINIGEKAVIEVKIIKNNNYFEGDTRNGITTSDFRYISDLCFIFGEAKSEEEYYNPKKYLVKLEKKK